MKTGHIKGTLWFKFFLLGDIAILTRNADSKRAWGLFNTQRCRLKTKSSIVREPYFTGHSKAEHRTDIIADTNVIKAFESALALLRDE